MLALSRRLGESVMIGEDIEIKIVDISGGQVRIGISAPREVNIARKEIVVSVNQNKHKPEPGNEAVPPKSRSQRPIITRRRTGNV